ncbi:MAG: FtsX-like permease family protein [Bacteroidales bacterium]|nr:FtsX-like permease family protein [Bacteroidales bacterium]
MSRIKLILKSFVYYWRKNLAVGIGVAVSTAILTGALVVGDSMQYSLQRLVDLRLGEMTHTLNAGDRFFTRQLAFRMEKDLDVSVAPVLLLEGSAVVDGGQKRLPKVQVLGVNDQTDKVFGLENWFADISDDEVIISENLAKRLDLKIGEPVLFRIRKASLIPLNAPFVSDEEISMSLRLTVKAIADQNQMARFSLHNSQTAPFNAFISLTRLDRLMELNGQVNTLLIAGSGIETEQIEESLQNTWELGDLGLKIKETLNEQEWEITSDRVFLDDVLVDQLLNTQWSAEPIVSYFVNKIEANNVTTPYSFLSTLPDAECGREELVINKWLADDLKVDVGDSLTITYYEVGPLRRLTVKDVSFSIKSIEAMKGRFADPSLTPDLPGLSDAGNCRDWETGVPIDLESIRDKDEDYWDEWKGSPKAFVALSTANELWSNRFGSLTAVRYKGPDFSEKTFQDQFSKDFQIRKLGFVVLDARESGQRAALEGVDFGELFLGLSFFVLLAGVILSLLLYNLTIQSRVEQIGVMRSIGLTKSFIRGSLLAEIGLISIVGGLLGLLLTWAYNELIFAGLNGIWQGIIRTDVISLRLNPGTLATGYGISVLIGITGLFFAVNTLLNKQLAQLKKGGFGSRTKGFKNLETYVAILSGIIAIMILMWQVLQNKSYDPTSFFMAGGLLLLSLSLSTDLLFYHLDKSASNKTSNWRLAWKNAVRNRGRSFSIILLLALGTFLIVTVGANRKNPFGTEISKESGTGGFLFFAETTVPVLQDLNDQETQSSYSMDQSTEFVQIRVADGDDASCLNLHAVSHPRLLGVDPEFLSGRFSFATKTPYLDEENPWGSLDQEFEGNIIPGIADQTIIQWSLMKSVGDTLWYTDQLGEEYGIVLIGGLVSSIFQGNLIISEDNFIKHYPSSSGSGIFLVEGDPAIQGEIAEELNSGLRDFGLNLQFTPERLAEFSSVENTYLSIFLLLGALGLLIGTLGLGIVLARSVQERQQEIALQRAIGIPRHKIFTGILIEFSGLMILGILIGSISAITAVFPGLISPGSEVQVTSLIGLIALIILNGLIWISIFASFSMRKENLALVLKSE